MVKKLAKILARIILTIWSLIWFVYLSSESESPRVAFMYLGLLSIPVIAIAFLLIYFGKDRSNQPS